MAVLRGEKFFFKKIHFCVILFPDSFVLGEKGKEYDESI